jgi:nucleoside 2-deoxyribosyltransferase
VILLAIKVINTQNIVGTNTCLIKNLKFKNMSSGDVVIFDVNGFHWAGYDTQ